MSEYSRPASAGRLRKNAKGEISYHAPWVTAAKRKPFKLTALNPRVDKTADKVIERIKADISKKVTPKHAAYFNRPVGDGWKQVPFFFACAKKPRFS